MRDFKDIKRIVIKIGSSSLVNKNLSINDNMIDNIMHNIKMLKDKGIDVALVSSGAIASGMYELNLNKKPKELSLKQACASVGQARLMEIYNLKAAKYNLHIGQILLNHDDFEVRLRMNYLTQTLDSMFMHNIIPIINENDTLAVEEIKVGDNDTLAALISPMVQADLLILFSDIDGLYDKNPKLYNDAKLISDVYEINDDIVNMASGATSNVGTGGMSTKINAANIVTLANSNMIICNSNKIDKLLDIVEGNEIGTLFHKRINSISSREHWMIFKTNSKGYVVVDDGLSQKLNDTKVSILPKGIISVSGNFINNSIIDIKNKNGEILAKGITNYSSSEINLIKGRSTNKLEEILGYKGKGTIIHANNLVLLKELLWKIS